jgi:4-hydroxy-tetrahydrodipicolinate reductase
MSSIRVLVTGANGRMGREVVHAVNVADDMEVVATVNREDNLQSVITDSHPDVLVEFTTPESVMANVRTALQNRVIPLVGTTGIGPAEVETLRQLCTETQTACLIAPNFALGAILLMRFSAEAARYFPDVEIIELHHEQKKDAPSGTAAKTAEMIASVRTGTPRPAPSDAFEAFVGARGGRAAGEIPVHSVRLPGFVASQEVIFGGPGQRLTLRHDSIDRASFMPGVVLAIQKAATLSGLVYGLEHLL